MKKVKTAAVNLLKGFTSLAIIASLLVIPATPVLAAECEGVPIAIEVGCKPDENPIYSYAKALMRVLSILVAVVVVGAIIVGGIMYSSARDDKGQAEKAIEVIRNAVIGLLLYIGMAAILNFIVPGGLFT